MSLETVTRPLCIGGNLDEAVGFILSLPQSQQLFADAAEDTVAGAVDAVRAAFAPYAGPHGVVMDGTAWLVAAYR